MKCGACSSPYRPGELSERIEIFRVNGLDDGYGGETTTSTSLGSFWAKVKPTGGGEKKDQDRVHDTAKYRFTIRYTDQIREDDYISWRGHEFNIRMIYDYGPRSMHIEIEAEKNAQR